MMKYISLLKEKKQTLDRYAWLAALVFILVLAAGLIYGRLTTGHNWGDDFAGYIGQAKSIVENNVDGYVKQNANTIQNSNLPRRQIGPVAYPWGYPLLLAMIYPTCGLNIFCLKLLNIPIYLLFLIVLFFLLNRHLTKTESLLIVGLFAVNPVFLDYQDNLLSDIPFLLFSTLTIWLTDCSLMDEKAKNNWILQAWLGFILFLPFFIRTAGILLVATLFAGQFIQVATQYWKTRKIHISYPIFIPYLVFGALYLISNVLLPLGAGSYISELSIIRKDILYNLWYYRYGAFYFFNTLPAFSIFSWVLFGLALIGMLLTISENYIFALYTLATVGLYVVWPYPSTRFLFGIAPFIFYFVYYPIRYGLSRLLASHTTWRSTILAVLFLALGLHFSWYAARIVNNNLLHDRVLLGGPFSPQSADAFEFIREQTPSNARVVFFKPRILSLLTGRTAWVFNKCKSLNNSDFVVLTKDEGVDALHFDTIKACNPERKLDAVFENDMFVVYQEDH